VINEAKIHYQNTSLCELCDTDSVATKSRIPDSISCKLDPQALKPDRLLYAGDADGRGVYSETLNAIPQMVWLTPADNSRDHFNDRWRLFTGNTLAAQPATRWQDLLHPEDRAAASSQWQRSLATGMPYRAEQRLRRHDGAYRWTLNQASPVRAADGSIKHWCGTFTDIHDLKEAEEQLKFVATEQSHRIQNIFAIIEGMLMLSCRSEPQAQAFAEAACARIAALSRANAYIRPACAAEETSEQITLHGLFDRLLAPYRPDARNTDGHRLIRMTGPDIAIGPSAATWLALVIHELATNAAKHGALATGVGSLSLATTVDTTSLLLVWIETGGLLINGAPTRRGFGTILTDRALRISLGAKVEQRWEPTGLTVRIEVERARLAA